MRRFLLLALPLLILTMGLFQFAMEMLGLQVDPSRLAPGGGVDLPGYVSLATWALEALGLAALFLLVHGRSGGWTSGLLTGWIAWVFRGPLLVVAVVGLAGLPPRPWWALALSWWVLYSVCGLLLSGVAAGVGLGAEAPPRAEPVPEPPPEPFDQPVLEEELVPPPPPADRLEQE
ncbi:MAG: hypothetical protein ACJ76J_00055 [Thermoanaerobaculia bacterium]